MQLIWMKVLLVNWGGEMKKNIKIVIVGAGSTSFGLSMIRDAFATKELWGSELVLVDNNISALKLIFKVATRMNIELNADFKISMTTNRIEAFQNAKYIIISIAVNRNEMWIKDFTIPQKYGVKHILGENGGPGSVFHTMRNIPVILEICKDIEDICPDAVVINFTNPESRICLAINKYTSVKAIGLCHQIYEGIKIISKIMERADDSFEIKAYGINHFTWVKEIRDKKTCDDLYPVLQEKEKNYNSSYEPLTRFLFHKFGLFPTSGDIHLGEYISYAHEMVSTEGYKFKLNEQRRNELWSFIKDFGNNKLSLTDEFKFPGHGNISLLKPSGERAFDIIRGIECDTNEVIDSANVPNEDYIENLPRNSIVEVPVIVNGYGVKGIKMGDLPRGISAMCINEINIQHLVVDAGVTGNNELVQQALLIDSTIGSANAAMGIYSEMMKINKEYYPQFYKE